MPDVMKTFSPSMTQSSPSRRAVVRKPATSEPAPGSVMASAAIFSPRSTAGITSCCSCGVPCLSTGGRPMFSENRLAIRPPLPLWCAIVVDTALRSANGAGVPPKLSG